MFYSSAKSISSQSNQYLVTAPKVFTSDQESVCVVFFESNKQRPNSDLHVRLSNPQNNETLYERRKRISSNSECVEIPTAKINSNLANLNVHVDGVFSDTRDVTIQPTLGMTLIETSKPRYEPDEEQQFRIFSFNQWLKPVEQTFQRIWVENSQSTPVMEWKKVRNNQGLLSYQLPLAELNTQGVWTIRALDSQKRLIEKTFEVLETSEAPVSVHVQSPGYVLAHDKSMTIEVCATNKFGHPVSGNAKIIATYHQNSDEQSNPSQSRLPTQVLLSPVR